VSVVDSMDVAQVTGKLAWWTAQAGTGSRAQRAGRDDYITGRDQTVVWNRLGN
jgi:hypothetical protein